MIVVKTREFRSNMIKYLKLVNEGEKVILTSRSHGSFKLTPLDREREIIVRQKNKSIREEKTE